MWGYSKVYWQHFIHFQLTNCFSKWWVKAPKSYSINHWCRMHWCQCSRQNSRCIFDECKIRQWHTKKKMNDMRSNNYNCANKRIKTLFWYSNIIVQMGMKHLVIGHLFIFKRFDNKPIEMILVIGEIVGGIIIQIVCYIRYWNYITNDWNRVVIRIIALHKCYKCKNCI